MPEKSKKTHSTAMCIFLGQSISYDDMDLGIKFYTCTMLKQHPPKTT